MVDSDNFLASELSNTMGAEGVLRARSVITANFGGGTIERRSLSEEVAERLMEMMASGNLKPGDRLPTEQQMCLAFGISRPPLREALKALSIMGLLVSRQGGRYTVSDLSLSRIAVPLRLSKPAQSFNYDEHFEARDIVELQAVRLCAARATGEERVRIMKLATDGQQFVADPTAFRLLDIEFHDAVNAGSHNAHLATLGKYLYDVGLDVRRVASTIPGVIETSVHQHVEVAEAIVAADADRAEASLRRHLEHVRDSALKTMKHGGE